MTLKAALCKTARQYKLLMWKNFTLLRRSPFRVVAEIFWPLALFIILWAVRSKDSLLQNKSQCHFHNKPMPSAGLLPFFQGIVCTSSNNCNNNSVTDELSGRLTSFDTTLINQLVNDTANLLANKEQSTMLYDAVQEAQKVFTALQKVQSNESLAQLVGIDEPTFYKDLVDKGVPLSNGTVDLFLNNAIVNPSAVLDELFRIQSEDENFAPLLEKFLVDVADIQGLVARDSNIWLQAFTEDLVYSLEDIPNLTLPSSKIIEQIGNTNLSRFDIGGLLSQLQGISSPTDVQQLVTNFTAQSGIGDVVNTALNLTSEQQDLLNTYCEQEQNANTSSCLLAEILNSTGSIQQADISNLCSQARYQDLMTCILWNFTSVQSIDEASVVASALCNRNITKNSSLCDMVEIQRRLNDILVNVDPREVLCFDNTSVITYDNDQVRGEVQPAICNLTQGDLEALLATVVDNINITAARELYFPDGFNPEEILKLAVLIDKLSELPAVQKILSELQSLQNSSLMTSFCGAQAQSGALLAGFAAGMLGNNGTSNENRDTGGRLSQLDEFNNQDSESYNMTKECKQLFAPLLGQGYGDIVFKQLSPIIFGKIPYSPLSSFVNETIKGANRTFEIFAAIKSAANDIRTNYKNWEGILNNYGVDLSNVDRILNFTTLGNSAGIDGAGTQQQFLEAVFGFAPLSGLPFNSTATPSNITEIVLELARDVTALEPNGTVYNTLDWIGSLSSTVYQVLDCIELNKFEPHPSEYDLEKRSKNLIEDDKYWAAIVFDEGASDLYADAYPQYVRYKIRMNTDKVDDTDRIEDKYWTPGPRADPPFDTKYITYGFAYLQDMVEHSLINLISGDDEPVGMYLQQFPYPCYNVDYFVRGVSRSLPLFMILSWIFSVALLVKSIVYEKQERLKEQMKIMGLNNGIQWVAWYSTSFVLIVPSIIILCLIFKYGRVLMAANALIMALFLFSFSFATTGLAFLISVFFTRANLAACCGAVIYFSLYMPYALIYQYEERMTEWQKNLACLLSPIAFGIGTTYVSRYEEQGVGIQWSNISSSPIPDDNYNLLKCIIFLFGDGLIYWAIAWYKEHVFPGQYGMPQPFYFMFTKEFWCDTDLGSDADSAEYNDSNPSNVDLEDEPTHLQLGVQIKNLTKVYKSGKKLAVNGLSLNLYEDQITSFLGHNGAGKTTTMSILCGLFPPTKGTAVIYNKDIRKNFDDIRKSMGFCPQFNVLYETLTVAEHILFYGQLKGLSYVKAVEEMELMLKATGMEMKRDVITKNLSGGMKRKVSVMCAFVGGSKCVVLDEPTAGVDPYSRRQIWELLLNFKHGRTILLSTHHMDEADFLGDRIAIISHGRLCCAGSSLYLKALYGSGYYLTLAKSNQHSATSDGVIEAFITKRVPGATVRESDGQEIVFQLPSSEVRTGAFVTLFNDLDCNLEKLGVSSYGICDTSLEEVFLKIAEETGVDAEDTMTDGGNLARPVTRQSFRLRSGLKRTFNKLFGKNIAKVKAKSNRYEKQRDDMSSVGTPEPMDDFTSDDEPDPELENVANNKTVLGGQTGEDEPENDYDGDELNDNDTLSSPEGQSPQNTSNNTGRFDGDRVKDEDLTVRYNSNQAELPPRIPVSDPEDLDAKGTKVAGPVLLWNQVRALLIKRFHHIRRDKIAFFCEVVLPAAFVLLAMAFALAIPPVRPQPPLELQPWMYERGTGKHLTAFYSNEYPDSNFTKRLEVLMKESHYGTRCMNSDVYQIADLPCVPAVETGWSGQGDDIIPECDCQTTGYQQCSAPRSYPASATLRTNDFVANLTSHEISEWLLRTTETYIKKRYGGFSFDVGGTAASVNDEEIRLIISTIFPNTSDPQTAKDISETIEDLMDSVNIHENIKVWFNNKGWTSSVSYMNAANNLVLRSKILKAGRQDYSRFGITAVNHPMNRTDFQFEQELINQSYLTLLISLCVIFAMSLIPATFVLYLIMDKVSTSKNLQFVSGMSRLVYWCTNFVWDMFSYAICASLCFLIFLVFNEQTYVSSTNGPCLALLLLMYGWAMIPFMYPFSYVFKESSMAYVVLGCLNIFLGIVSTTSTFILESFPADDDLKNIAEILKQVFVILLPHYCLGRGIIDIAVEHLRTEIENILGREREYDPFSWDITGKNMMALFIQGCFFFLLVILIEFDFFCRPRRNAKKVSVTDVEEDVLTETTSILSGDRFDDALQAKNLTKAFRKHRAVNDLTFGVPKNQCFGLLGVNGAGKTTTFSMLTGLMRPSGGDAEILGNSVVKKPTEVQRLLGYCPQFDAIDPLLTGREHLEYYARLRGIPYKNVEAVAAQKIRKMGLTRYADKRAGDYSGGNKRKLQAAIALIGNPAIIFMDEPTTGMDPKARRFLWDCILKVTKEGHAVVLTSHSMEECEVLCNRLAIMVNGAFRCIGSPQHLKNKYGDGYHVTIRISRTGAPDIAELLNAMDSRFHTSAQLLESSLTMAQYHISSNIPVADIFSRLEEIRKTGNVEDYSVTQTSLDHVFIRFARFQKESLEEDDGISGSSIVETSSLNSSTASSYTISGSSRLNLIV